MVELSESEASWCGETAYFERDVFLRPRCFFTRFGRRRPLGVSLSQRFAVPRFTSPRFSAAYIQRRCCVDLKGMEHLLQLWYLAPLTRVDNLLFVRLASGSHSLNQPHIVGTEKRFHLRPQLD